MNKFITNLLIFLIAATSGIAAQWAQTSGPKQSGNYVTVTTLLKLSDGSFLAGTESTGIYKTTNSGDNWNKVFNYSNLIWTINKSENGRIFVGTDLGGIYRSTDDGVNFTNVFNPSSLIFDFAFNSSNHIFACTELFGVYKSTDNGSSWNLLWDTDLIPVSIVVNSLGNIFVGTGSDGIYLSTDGGATFNNIAFSGDFVWDLYIDQNDDIFACTETQGLNKSIDDGSNWDNLGFPSSSTSKYFVSSTGKQFLVVDATEVYQFNENNLTWDIFTDGLSNLGINDFGEDDQGFILAGTYGAGAFRSTVSTLNPEITTLSATNTEYCAGEFFTINYTSKGGFDQNNNFKIELSDADGIFSSPLVIGSTLAQSSGSIDCVIPFDLAQGANHKIRILSTLPAIVGPESASFVINALNTTLNQPADLALKVSLKPAFTWDNNLCALSFTLQVSTTSDFSNIIVNEVGIGNSTFTLTNPLEKNTVYYWRIGLTSLLGDEYFTSPNSFTTLSTVTQTINLASNWNLISSYITLPNMNVELMLAGITSNLLIAKSPNGLVYIPDLNINTIQNWNSSQAYQLFMKNAATLDIEGDQIVPEGFSLALNAGWNKISYLRSSELDCAIAFAGITDDGNLLIAKNFAGAVYIPSLGINTIGNMIPGQGYLIYVPNADSFTYPAN